jgi:hypothetical protein
MNALPSQYLVRRQAHQMLVERGFPLGWSTFNKLCAPAVGKGPVVAAWWPGGRGRNELRPLYEPQAVIDWAKTLLKSPSPNL